MKTSVCTIIIAAFITLLSVATSEAGWLIYHESELKGQILDIDTKQPIEGAVVVVVYQTATPGLGAGQGSSCIDVREALTDKEGKFLIPSYTTIIQPFSWKIPGEVIIYKAGYASLTSLQGVRPSRFVGMEATEREGTWRQSELKYKLRSNGIVELPKIETWEDRRRANSVDAGSDCRDKTTILKKLVDEEDEDLRKKQRR